MAARSDPAERALHTDPLIDQETRMNTARVTTPVPARFALGATTLTMALLPACGGGSDDAAAQAALVEQGRQIFRFDTFGDEAQWTDTLRLHEVIAAAVDPLTALSVGLKVDAKALPATVVAGIRNGSIDLASPATTVALLKLNAVVGIVGTVQAVDGVDRLTRVGITCALCHSTVDDSFAPGIGQRLDGWPNRDLNPGAIIALSPALDDAAKAVFNGWGRGRFDPRHNIDGLSKPVVIPPAYGLAGIDRITVTGDGNDIAYWNRYVAVAEMGGQGTVTEPRLNLAITHGTQDLVSAKLPALQAYQITLKAPAATPGSYDTVAAARGRQIFEGAGQCATCHAGAEFTDANARLHPVGDSMAEPESPSYASRSATKQYRTSPLKGLWQHAPYFHDGSAATLGDVVQAYDAKRSLGLSAGDAADLVEYLKSL
jgi:mono/diheme cytochrome c family protein